MADKRIKVTLVKSTIGRVARHRACVRGLGLRRLNHSVEVIDTPENRSAMPTADPNNWVSPEKLANVILFLCSEEASAVHGTCIPVVGLS